MYYYLIYAPDGGVVGDANNMNDLIGIAQETMAEHGNDDDSDYVIAKVTHRLSVKAEFVPVKGDKS
jgi:hypothetical protein